MRRDTRRRIYGAKSFHLGQVFYGLLTIFCLDLVGCTNIGEIMRGSAANPLGKPIVHAPANFDVALKETQTAQAAGKIAVDVALFNTGVILAHPSNPRKDYPRAIVSFKALVAQHPQSALVEQSKTWIQVLEQLHKVSAERQKVLEEKRALIREVSDERQKVAEEKRALIREREMLVQERQKQNYSNEKSRQLDLEIERRRRQSLRK